MDVEGRLATDKLYSVKGASNLKELHKHLLLFTASTSLDEGGRFALDTGRRAVECCPIRGAVVSL